MAAITESDFIERIGRLILLEQSGEGGKVTIHLGPYSAFVLVGALQLAWRHPQHSPKMKQVIEDIARQVQAGFAPEYQELLDAGWDTSRDVHSS